MVIIGLYLFLILGLKMSMGNPYNQVLPPLQYPESLKSPNFYNSQSGAYFFQYDTGYSRPASFRGESRDVSGSISGYYGYIDENNVMRITHYWADEKGFRSVTNLRYLKQDV